MNRLRKLAGSKFLVADFWIVVQEFADLASTSPPIRDFMGPISHSFDKEFPSKWRGNSGANKPQYI
jgi:hypothetical protein